MNKNFININRFHIETLIKTINHKKDIFLNNFKYKSLSII